MGLFGFGKKKQQQDEMLDIPPPPPLEGMSPLKPGPGAEDTYPPMSTQFEKTSDQFPPMDSGMDTHFEDMQSSPPELPPLDLPPLEPTKQELSRKSFAEMFEPKQESWAPPSQPWTPPAQQWTPPQMPAPAPLPRMMSSKPLFVEIGKYRDVIKELNMIKKGLRESDEEIKELVSDIDDEEKTFAKLHKGLQDVEAKLADLEKCLFVQE